MHTERYLLFISCLEQQEFWKFEIPYPSMGQMPRSKGHLCRLDRQLQVVHTGFSHTKATVRLRTRFQTWICMSRVYTCYLNSEQLILACPHDTHVGQLEVSRNFNTNFATGLKIGFQGAHDATFPKHDSTFLFPLRCTCEHHRVLCYLCDLGKTV